MRSITDYLDNIIAIYSEKIAYIDENRQMCFSDIQREANAIAMFFIKKQIRKCAIMVFLDKSCECISTFFGIAYSGNFYSPIDTKMPVQRIKKIFNLLQPEMIITDYGHQGILEDWVGETPVYVVEELIEEEVDKNLLQYSKERIVNTDVLYVLFTSGSTGDPKGVVISHRAVINYMDWITSQFDIRSDDVIGNEAPLYFDLSIQDVYAPIFTGCTTLLIDRKRFSFPTSLMAYLADQNVTMIMWVPSMLCLVANLKGLNVKRRPALNKVFFCGEVMPNKQLNLWRKAYPHAMFVNFYGPTEACDACGYFIVDRSFEDDEMLPIGFSAPNVELFLLDKENRKIEKTGSVGEICIRGVQLSDGYYRDPERTKEAFVQNPLMNAYSETIYRTGDLGSYNIHKELMYISRKDFQIKHMGHRIELGEVESIASAAGGMERCCCVYDDKEQKIVLYYTGSVDTTEFEGYLKEQLPYYMIPAERIHLTRMPLNANGKIDRNELKERMIHGRENY